LAQRLQLSPARLAAIAAITLVAASAWWLLPDYSRSSLDNASAQSALAKSQAAAAAALTQASQVAAGAALAGTPGDSFLTPDLRQTFEAMLLEATGGQDIGDPALLKNRLAALLPAYFPADLQGRAGALIERYVDYRVALSSLKPPADPGDPRALRSALEARQRVRQQHFTGDEYEALFALEARLDRYTLARIEIERNTELSTAQKTAALKGAEQDLSEAQRSERDQAMAHIGVAAQTNGFDARGVSDVERYAQRSAQYGDAAASQLAQLDREERDWQTRLNTYAAAQAAKGPPEQLELMRQQLFSAPEQLRIDAALATRQLATVQR
jgi:lipase chaperone LimK